ncbi:hypothetical protein BD413DRAFT_231963 [Trametes elegans]|nr:hypothetical protein BD413DRAFT_231963 [Trametes elegans]
MPGKTANSEPSAAVGLTVWAFAGTLKRDISQPPTTTTPIFERLSERASRQSAAGTTPAMQTQPSTIPSTPVIYLQQQSMTII